jgi:uncharacterized delta-60 repeat protein
MKNLRSQTTRRAHGIVRVFLAIVAMALLVSWNFPVDVEASAGELDPAFGSGGKVTTDMGGNEGARASALQPDGKLIVAGLAESKKKEAKFAVARYNRDGSLDSSFGGDGVAGYSFDAYNDNATTVAIQPDGKIVVAGDVFTRQSLSYDFALVRFNSDGSLDFSFGSRGEVLLDFYGLEDRIYGVAIQPDGKIIAAGWCDAGGGNDFALARFNPGGSVDTSFGSQGRVNTDFFHSSDTATAVAIQSDGRIVLAGSESGNFALARYNSDGMLDPTFGAEGKVNTDFHNDWDWANALVIEPDGKILVAGYAGSGAASVNYDFALARYNADGSFDPSFGDEGRVSTDFFGNVDSAYDILIQPDGHIIVTGFAATSADFSSDDFALARYNSDGSLDTSFGLNGKVNTDFFGDDDWAFDAVLTLNGRVIAVGLSTSGSTRQDIALACYKAFEVTPQITGAEVIGKKLYVYGNGFDFDADVLMNGAVQKKTTNDAAGPSTMLIAKKTGKKIDRGETVILQVRNPDGTMSNEYSFTRPVD